MLTLALLLAAPATALAGGGTLLSGYGGPGSGDQAILGATLLKGPSSGGHGGGGAGQATAAPQSLAAPTASESSAPPTKSHPRGAGGDSHAKPAAHRSHGAAGPAATKPATPATGEPPLRAMPAGESASAGGLGLSGSDVALIVIALAVIAASAIATRVLAASPQGEGPRLKGRTAAPE